VNTELSLQLPEIRKLPAKTPISTRQLKRCTLLYQDGTEETLEVEDDQGFHRIESYKAGEKKIIIHEVFIAYGH